MYLHLGRDIAVSENSIVAVFDFDTATASKKTQRFLTLAEKKGQVIYITEEIPKSAVVCVEGGKQTIYISQLSSKTLLNRSIGDISPDSVI